MSKNTINTKSKKKLKLVIIILLIALICGMTYAYFTSNSESDKYQITTGDLEITYESGQNINASFVIPTEENEAYLHEFTIENIGTLQAKYNISFDNISLTKDSLNTTSNNLLWKLYKSSSTYEIIGDPIAIGSFGSNSEFGAGNTFLTILKNQTLDVDLTQSYVLKVWLNEANVLQNEDQNMRFSAKVFVEALQNPLAN